MSSVPSARKALDGCGIEEQLMEHGLFRPFGEWSLDARDHVEAYMFQIGGKLQ